MKIALISNSLLLDRSLEIYLKDYITSYKQCDFVVSTEKIEQSDKPVFLIGDYEDSNLKKPFTKEILLERLESFFLKLQKQDPKTQNTEIANNQKWQEIVQQSIKTESSNTNLTLQDKLEEILRRYAKEIEETIKEHIKNEK